MTKPVDVARCIAAGLGIDFATVRQRARVLRDAGLVEPNPKGRGKGTTTPRDAASLLIVSAMGEPLVESARVASAMRSAVDRVAHDITSGASGGPYAFDMRVSSALTRTAVVEPGVVASLSALFDGSP